MDRCRELTFVGQTAVVTDPASTTYSFTQIILNGNGHVTFIDSDDRLNLDQSDMAGDLSSQLCSYGTINASQVILFFYPNISITKVTTITGFGLCCQGNGQLNLPTNITVIGVNCNIEGILNGTRNLILQNSASFTLSALGRSFGFSSSIFSFNAISVQSNSNLLISPGFICIYVLLISQILHLEKELLFILKISSWHLAQMSRQLDLEQARDLELEDLHHITMRIRSYLRCLT